MKKFSVVKVALLRVVDQYTREDKCVIISAYPVTKPIKEVKAFFDAGLAKHFACIAECQEQGPLPLKMAQAMIDACRKESPCVMVFNLLDEERAEA